MYEPNFWIASAEAMELTIEGNRLIATAIVQGVRNLGRRVIGQLDSALNGLGKHQHLPPV